MTNTVLQAERTNPMDRVHYTKPEDLLQLAPSFIEFNIQDPQTSVYTPKFFVHDFLHAARELGHDVEHTEALVILEDEKKRLETEYEELLKLEVDDIFNQEWLLQVPFESVEEFIDLYNQGQCWEYVNGRFSELIGARIDSHDITRAMQDPIFAIYDRALDNDVPKRISELIKKYQQDPDKFRQPHPRTVFITEALQRIYPTTQQGEQS